MLTITPFAPLFAVEGEQVGIYGLLVLVGGGIGWFLTWLDGRRKESLAARKEEAKAERDQRKEDEKPLIEHLNAVNARLDKDRQECREDLAAVHDELTDVKSHMRYLEGIMESQGIKFRPYVPRAVARAGQRLSEGETNHE